MLAVIPYPEIDPIIFSIGPIAIRWYALAYIAGLLLGWRYVQRRNRGPDAVLDARAVDDLLVWIALGVVLGGRFGYVLFYNFAYYAENPAQAFAVWRGGMSFHGGVLGVAIALFWFAKRRGVGLLRLADLVIPAIPIGLFFGRLANFINGELFGRATDVPWAMVFPNGGPAPRHPSQLYEAGLEGLLLFVVLWWLGRNPAMTARPGVLTGTFLAGYAVSRGLIELFREPDPQLGLLAGVTMGQWLSLPMLLAGAALIVWAYRHRTAV